MKASSVLIALLLWCGCSANPGNPVEARSSPTPPITSSETHSDKSAIEAKVLWDGQRLFDYDMTISLETTSFLEPARVVAVQVRKAKPVSVKVPDPADKRGRLAFYDPYTTVENMFTQIESLRQRSGSVSVKYNNAYGFPEEIEYSEPNPDASFKFRVLDFRPVILTEKEN